MLVRVGDIRVRASSGVVENLAVYVLLGTCFILHGVRRILPSECNVVPWHSCTQSIFSLSPTGKLPDLGCLRLECTLGPRYAV